MGSTEGKGETEMTTIDAGEGMSLDRALFLLARVHTRDDDQIGFVIQAGAGPDWGNLVSHGEYIEAWAVVRTHLHLPTGPGDQL